MQAKAPAKLPMRAGFTLIEMAIVLVIIGLIAGAVVVGQDLMRAAGVRATISQIEKYNTAVNTFREKYGYLPGDINASAAALFGFLPRGIYHGMGDGDGYIEGLYANSPSTNTGYAIGYGETAMVWVDLSMANLIDGGFNTSTMLSRPPGTIPGAGVRAPLPTPNRGGGELYLHLERWRFSLRRKWLGWLE
jgi:prepilin-type N-terminal cleavage/methylation domain-containing protein